MAAQQVFRTALNGFNREDVIRYIEQLNAKHAAQISNLNAELEYLQAQQDASVPAPTAGEDSTLIEQQAARIRELFDRCKELEAELETLKAGKTTSTDELEAYRRAERAERLAKERADAMNQQINGILADATVRVEDASAQIDTVSGKVIEQLEDLRCALVGSKKVLKETAATLYSLRPETKEE